MIPQEMQSAIYIVLWRFAEYHNLAGAFGRRAVTERAKGILIERHGIEEEAAFDMLRDRARRTHRKLVDLADRRGCRPPMLPARATQPEPSRSRRAKARQLTGCRGLLKKRRVPSPVETYRRRRSGPDRPTSTLGA
jgi:hypothetical protein